MERVKKNFRFLSRCIFMIVIAPVLGMASGNELPDNPFSKKAVCKVEGKGIDVSYELGEGIELSSAMVERAGENGNFMSLGLIKGAHASSRLFFRDEKPLKGTNYYRITFVTTKGITEMSEPAPVHYKALPGSLVDTETHKGTWLISGYHLSGVNAIRVEIIGSDGRPVAWKHVAHQNGEFVIKLNSTFLKPGAYTVRVSGGGVDQSTDLMHTKL